MRRISNKIYQMFGGMFLGLGFTTSVYAICPLCAIAVGAGVGLAQWLGVDDTITGLWIGGLVVSLIMWNIDWFNRKNIRFMGRNILTIIGYYLIVIFPLYYPMGIIGHPLNRLWGVDKLVLGIIIGSISFFLGGSSYNAMKKHHGGHAYFPFQKVVMPVAPLLILSSIFYFITR